MHQRLNTCLNIPWGGLPMFKSWKIENCTGFYFCIFLQDVKNKICFKSQTHYFLSNSRRCCSRQLQQPWKSTITVSLTSWLKPIQRLMCEETTVFPTKQLVTFVPPPVWHFTCLWAVVAHEQTCRVLHLSTVSLWETAIRKHFLSLVAVCYTQIMLLP